MISRLGVDVSFGGWRKYSKCLKTEEKRMYRVKYYRADGKLGRSTNDLWPTALAQVNIDNLKSYWGEGLYSAKIRLMKLLPKHKDTLNNLPQFPQKRKQSNDKGSARKRQRVGIDSAVDIDTMTKTANRYPIFAAAWSAVQRKGPKLGVKAAVVIPKFQSLHKLLDRYDVGEEDYDSIEQLNSLRFYERFSSHDKLKPGMLIYYQMDYEQASQWPKEIVIDLLMPYQKSLFSEDIRFDMSEAARKEIISEMPEQFLMKPYCECEGMIKVWMRFEDQRCKIRVLKYLDWLWKKCNPNANGMRKGQFVCYRSDDPKKSPVYGYVRESLKSGKVQFQLVDDDAEMIVVASKCVRASETEYITSRCRSFKPYEEICIRNRSTIRCKYRDSEKRCDLNKRKLNALTDTKKKIEGELKIVTDKIQKVKHQMVDDKKKADSLNAEFMRAGDQLTMWQERIMKEKNLSRKLLREAKNKVLQ